MEEKIMTIIRNQFNLDEDQLDLDTNFQEDLDADSLDLIEMIMVFEDEFNVEIEDEDVTNIETVSDAIKEVEKIV